MQGIKVFLVGLSHWAPYTCCVGLGNLACYDNCLKLHM